MSQKATAKEAKDIANILRILHCIAEEEPTKQELIQKFVKPK
jgi:hypothetical protein